MHCVATGRSVSFSPTVAVRASRRIHGDRSMPRSIPSVRHAGIRPVRPIGCDLAALHGGLRNKPASQTCINTPSSSIGPRACVLARHDSSLPFPLTALGQPVGKFLGFRAAGFLPGGRFAASGLVLFQEPPHVHMHAYPAA